MFSSTELVCCSPRELNSFVDRTHNQFGLFEIDTAMAAVFRNDELGSGDLVQPFLVKLQSNRDAFHLGLLDFVEFL